MNSSKVFAGEKGVMSVAFLGEGNSAINSQAVEEELPM
jgi:hypothetical protein